MWTDDSSTNEVVKTDSFIIHYTKLGVVNVRNYYELLEVGPDSEKNDVFNFTLESPWLADLDLEDGAVNV